ncbi:MAG TPA: L,D-transpeptidase [Chitinophagaceae bacterium]|nr:L,D-transpeptidase [Chitinophagaceae bacterium]
MSKNHHRAEKDIRYELFKDSLLKTDADTLSDSTNIFDSEAFVPGKDSLDTLILKIDTVWHREAIIMEQLDSFKKGLKKDPGFTEDEKKIIRENIAAVDSFLKHRGPAMDSSGCKQRDCILYAEIDKSKQVLYLFLFGELKDTFKVSTGKGKYETPAMDLRPQGPVLTKYTSRKFPGGNYEGLGNMPYAVFLKGGYAIHGTTPGNFSKLGTRASHGCIRLHPDNAKVFNALVKTVGLNQTWVTIHDSIP